MPWIVKLMLPLLLPLLLLLLFIVVAVTVAAVATAAATNAFYFYFRNHQHGALNIFNSPNVTVKNCIFHNNNSTSNFTRKPFQGNGGGLSVGYNMDLAPLSNIDVLVTDCVFANNRATSALEVSSTTSTLLQYGIFSGRGGGMSITIKSASPLKIVVNNSLFTDNFASYYGGGLFHFISGIVGNQTYLFGNNTLIKNKASVGSGAQNFVNFGNSTPLSIIHTTIYNCTYEENKAQVSGCILVSPSFAGSSGSLITIEKCTFNKNQASSYSSSVNVASHSYYRSRLHLPPVRFVNW